MAVSAGVSSYFKLAQIIIGKVSFPPMMNSATIRSSKEMKNEKTADEMIAGRIAGKVTSQKACVGPAPKILAARSNPSPFCRIAAITMIMTSGSAMVAWARTRTHHWP